MTTEPKPGQCAPVSGGLIAAGLNEADQQNKEKMMTTTQGRLQPEALWRAVTTAARFFETADGGDLYMVSWDGRAFAAFDTRDLVDQVRLYEDEKWKDDSFHKSVDCPCGEGPQS